MDVRLVLSIVKVAEKLNELTFIKDIETCLAQDKHFFPPFSKYSLQFDIPKRAVTWIN